MSKKIGKASIQNSSTTENDVRRGVESIVYIVLISKEVREGIDTLGSTGLWNRM
jgi:hypothetical protein